MSDWTDLSHEMEGVRVASKNTGGDYPQLAAYVYDRISAYAGGNRPGIGARLIETAIRAAVDDAGEAGGTVTTDLGQMALRVRVDGDDLNACASEAIAAFSALMEAAKRAKR